MHNFLFPEEFACYCSPVRWCTVHMEDDFAFLPAVEPGNVVGEHWLQDGVDEGLGIHFCFCRNHVNERFSISTDPHGDQNLLWPIFPRQFS